MDLQNFIRVAQRRWWLLVSFALIGVLIGYATTPPAGANATTTYIATHSLLSAGDPSDAGGAGGTVSFSQVPVFVRIGEVPKRAATALGYSGSPVTLAATIKVNADPKTRLIEISTTSADPADAVRVADTFASEMVNYLTERRDQVTRDRQASLLTRIAAIEERVRQDDSALFAKPNDLTLRAQRDASTREYSAAFEEYQQSVSKLSAIGLTTLQTATAVPVKEGGLSVPRTRGSRTAIAGLVALLVGVAVANLAEQLDTRIRDRRQAEDTFDLPVIIEVPRFHRGERGEQLVVGSDSSLRLAEVYRTLRSSLMFLISNAAQAEPTKKSVGVIVVTSPGPGEGKTSTAANLAAAFAETGRQVLLVNADFRRPRISKFFMSERQLNALAQRKQEQSRSVKNTLISTKVRGVRLLDMSDVGGAPGKLARDSARAIASLRSSFDVVIVDTPPLSVSAEALEFISDATAVLVMARLGHTSIAAASRAADLLRYGGASNTVIGLSDTGSQAGAKYYGYYGYYNEKSAAKRSRFSRGKAAILADHRAVQEPEPRDEATDPWAGAHEAAWPQNDPSQQSR